MSIFSYITGFFKKKDAFLDMSRKEKRNFLSNDLIDRMIRVEQRVSASFGQAIPYNKTKYYLSLRENEKKTYINYLHNKNKKKAWFCALLVIPFLAFLSLKITGNTVSSNSNADFIAKGEFISLWILVILASIGLYYYISHRNKERRFNKVIHLFHKSMNHKRKR